MLAVFAIHLIVFARLAIVRKQGYYWLVAGLFAVLTLSFTLRLWVPELRLGDYHAHILLRIVAWAMAAVTLPILGLRLYRRFNR
ncbi:MAG: hypothetical protein R3200_10520 [Xanthomonadales bacterium]|nr:hypothetical protein [Xanthomonadales bacterium]